MPHVVAAIAYQNAPAFELAIPGEVFGTDVLSGRYRFLMLAGEPAPIQTDAGWTVRTDGGLNRLAEVDTVVVAGWRDPSATPPPRLLGAIQAAHGRGTRIVGLCTGSFVLAAAGLLDDRRATTHSRYADALARQYPRIRVDRGKPFAEAERIFTSGATPADLELCLELVRRDWGAATADAVANRLLAPIRGDDRAHEADADRAGAPLAWLANRLDDRRSVHQLAASAHVSVRHFHRLFRQATGTTPHAWLVDRRVAEAQYLLEHTTLPVETVASRTGFSPASLRAHFRRRLRMSPTAYRLGCRQPARS